MKISPILYTKMRSWLTSAGLRGLALKKLMLCIRYAIECNRPSLTWWEAISGLRRGFLRNGFLARYHERVDLASYVMANMGSQVIPIVVDYTDIDPAGKDTWRKVLVAAVPTKKGRAIPLRADLLTSSEINSTQELSENTFEKRFLRGLNDRAKALNKKLIIIGDRGYADGKLFLFLKKKGMGFVIRVPCNVEIETEEGEWVALRELLGSPSDKVIFLRDIRYSREHSLRLNILATWKRGEDEPWFIATNLSEPSDVLRYYKKRFLVEETFKSTKTHEKLERIRSRNRDVLLGMINVLLLACAFLILIGMAIESLFPILVPALMHYADRYSVYTKALLCLERLRRDCSKLLCPNNLLAIANQALFLADGEV